MAKITDLAAVDAITGDEFLPIVQRGSTKRATMTALRALIVPFLQYWYKGDKGEPGAAGNVAATLAQLKAAPVSHATMIAAYDGSGSTMTWTAGNFTSLSTKRPQDYVAAADRPITEGAWVRQRAAGIQHIADVAGAVPRPVSAIFDDLAISPESLGAVGDGIADDTAALQAAAATGRSIRLTPGRQYILRSPLYVTASNVSIGGGGCIKIAADWDFAADTSGPNTHMRAIFVSGAHVTFGDMIFDLSDAPAGTGVENGAIWSTGPFTSITSCQFLGNPKGTCIWGLSAWLNVQLCTFTDCTGAAFARGRNPIISNNIIVNATDAAIAINGTSCIGAVIVGNTITNESGALIPAMIAVEEGASDWVIASNAMIGVNGGGVWAGNVLMHQPSDGGIIADNLFRADLADGTGPVSANPATMIFVSPYYVGTLIDSNKARGLPSGNSDSCMLLVAATGTVVTNNVLDGLGAPGIAAVMRIMAGKGGITIRDNRSRAAGGVRHVLLGPGDYGNAPVSFVGGTFIGGAEAINAELRAASIVGLALHIENISEARDIAAIVNAPTAIGDRGAFLNAGAWQLPHRIGPRTEMYGTGAPVTGGALPFEVGDRIHLLEPASGGPLGFVRVPGGTPWVSMGAAG